MNTSTAFATSTPANGKLPSDDPPPHPGFDAPTVQSMGAPAKLFEQGERSQATQIEQARVVAEVQAAIVVAQNRPRDIERALAEMRKVCTIEMMAERAFYAYDKGGTTANGGSIHLARELGRIWGNVTYGMKELSRKDVRPGETYGESEMLAYAWDLQTNTRPETTFIVPHYMDTRKGRKVLKDARSIYENNSNMGARRLREQIFAVIPRWFRDEAEDICRQTLEAGGGKPFKVRLYIMFDVARQFGVTEAMIVKKVNKGVINLTAADLADLKITFRSIKNGEITKEEAFPETPAADVDAALAAKAAKTEGAQPNATPQTERQEGGQGAGQQVGQAAQADAGSASTEETPRAPSGPDELIAWIAAAKDGTEIGALQHEHREYVDALFKVDRAAHARIMAAVSKRRKEVTKYLGTATKRRSA